MTTPRHAPTSIVEQYHAQGVNGVLVIDGAPGARIQIAPQHRRLSLLVEVTGRGEGLDLVDRANLAYDLQLDEGRMWHRLDVTFDDNLAEVYPMICAVVDRVQLDGNAFSDAVWAVLDGLGDILAGRGGLSHEKQVGLFGELLAVLSLAAQASPTAAAAAWRGPAREEHDLGLPEADVEVKTTLSERRQHWISSTTQLVPTPGRDLYLLSLQITGAGDGPGATLTELARAALALPDGEKGLAGAGWHPRHADLYRARWSLRTTPEFYLVDDDFPAITPAHLRRVLAAPQRITDVRYRVDVEGLPAAKPLFPVDLAAGAGS